MTRPGESYFLASCLWLIEIPLFRFKLLELLMIQDGQINFDWNLFYSFWSHPITFHISDGARVLLIVQYETQVI